MLSTHSLANLISLKYIVIQRNPYNYSVAHLEGSGGQIPPGATLQGVAPQTLIATTSEVVPLLHTPCSGVRPLPVSGLVPLQAGLSSSNNQPPVQHVYGEYMFMGNNDKCLIPRLPSGCPPSRRTMHLFRAALLAGGRGQD